MKCTDETVNPDSQISSKSLHFNPPNPPPNRLPYPTRQLLLIPPNSVHIRPNQHMNLWQMILGIAIVALAFALWDRRPLPAFDPSIIRPSGPIRRQSVPSQWNPSSNSFNNYVVRLCDRCRRTHLGRILSTLAPLKTRRPPCLTTRKPSVELLTATN